ncbi:MULTISPECIES: heavy metal-associated domain-containing protein [unclassified Campylobacter]|uniref:heavy-metal-associated domain-containing protein n=1 Tax=unclassified Campylobacter TaxID=2593542 RepID=UPI001D272619|nr:heavy metal-associated domain-containing protein [Campylobacter sp. RM12651]MBZ7975630.1 heavy-metal-associated domain-containing protein [Campylobacter sp. RM12637]MBZ7992554.1 heavy-metal-associated domain-containing protein [Campylobacter sp. RM9333]ULO04239.1 heavy-metal-associated domain-containing protein, putative mercuric reductase [Campylobacter sp. RM12651]
MKKVLLLSLFLSVLNAYEYTLEIPKIHCPLCTAIVRKALLKIDGVNKVNVSLENKTAIIKSDKELNESIINQALFNTGYQGILK